MRISGGEAKGRVVRIPAGSRFRPTTDLVRESLFNIIKPVAGKSFLDLFAGSGLVGLEALSRGARLAVFVEKDAKAAEELGRVAELFGFDQKKEVMHSPVGRALAVLLRRRSSFDIVFADPPYNEGLAAEAVRFFKDGDLMAHGGVLIVQHSVRERVGEGDWGSLALTDQRRYGETVLSFFGKSDAGDDSSGK